MSPWPSSLTKRHKAALLALSGLVITATAQDPAKTNHFAVLSGIEGEKLLHQSSRGTPAVSGYWRPDRATVAQLEADLPALSALAVRSHWQSYLANIDMTHTDRQYVGILLEGRRYIYINGFPSSHASVQHSDKAAWRTNASVICDGGRQFWGALYDPLLHEFSELEGNGIA